MGVLQLQLLLVFAIVSGVMASKADIHIVVVTSAGTLTEPGAIVARQHILENSTLLQGHKIILQFFSEEGSLGHFFFLELAYNENILIVIGPLNSHSITISYPLLGARSIIQANANAVRTEFEDYTRFPYLFNFCSMMSEFDRTLLKVLKHQNWTRVAFLYLEDTSKYFSEYYLAASGAEKLARSQEIDVTTKSIPATFNNKIGNSEIDVKDIGPNLFQSFKDDDIRVYVYFMPKIAFYDVLCELYRLRLYGPKYVHIIHFGRGYENWKSSIRKTNLNCTRSETDVVIKNFIFLKQSLRENDDVMTASKFTAGEIYEQTEQALKTANGKRAKPDKMEDDEMVYYDIIWGFATVLDKVLKKEPTFANRHTRKYPKKNLTRMNVMAEKFEKLDFQGASGRIKFYKEGNIRRLYSNIKLIKYDNYTDNIATTSIYGSIGDDGIQLKHFKQRWAFPELPRDRALKKNIMHQNRISIVVIMWSFAGIGIFLAIIFLLFNIKYRNVTFIKLSSPNINNLICVGGIVLYSSVFLGGVDTSVACSSQIPLFCNITIVVLMIGYTLTFGSLFSKTWRIYKIFTKKNSIKSVVIRDTHLFSVVMLLLLIDFLLFVCFLLIGPFTLHLQELNVTMNVETDTIEKNFIYRCQSEYQTYFLAAIFVYKGLLLLFGLFLAYETKSIKVESINDSKYIGFSVYNVALFASLGSIVVAVLHNEPTHFETSYILFSICIIQTTTVTLCLIFGPKVWKMFKDPNYNDPNFRNGRPVIQNHSNNTHSSLKSG